MLLQASQWPTPLANGSTSSQVTPCMNFSYGAEREWMEETQAIS